MLDFLGYGAAHDAIFKAIEQLLADPHAPRTPDLGGRASTTDVGQALAAVVAAG